MEKYNSHIDLSNFNSFGVSAIAQKFYEFTNIQQLKNFFENLTDNENRWRVLGGGNNILLLGDCADVIIHPRAQNIIIEAQDQNQVTVYAEAGLEWDQLVEWSVENSLWGLENLSIIPGTVGAAPVQNIGAYGVEVKDCITSVEVFVPETLETKTLTREQCKFGYRDSIFKGELKDRVIITGVRFSLSTKANAKLEYGGLKNQVALVGEPSLLNIRNSVIEIRNSKLPDPKKLGNVGSFFKNPIVTKSFADELQNQHPDTPIYATSEPGRVKVAAGWLIDKAGWKGYKEGAVGVHESQALVLVNYGGASGQDILNLALKIIDDIDSKFSIKIEMEVNLW